MKLLLAVATKNEINPFSEYFGLQYGHINYLNHEIVLLITGVGMVATAHSLGRHLALEQYDLAINAGIAGSFDPLLNIGDVVAVREDHLAELGAEDSERFIRIEEMGFGESCITPLVQTDIDLSDLRQVKAITVNTVHGDRKSIEIVESRLQPQIETMEGAAFFYACNQVKLPCAQIRSISNIVEQRDTTRWDIGMAVKNLNNYLIKMVEGIN